MAFDTERATELGQILDAAAAMYSSDPKHPLQPGSSLPSTFTLKAWLQMSDLFFGKRFIEYYGVLAVRDAPPTDVVIAIRGTEGGTEAWDNSHGGFSVFDKTGAIAGDVHAGFFEIFQTLRLVPAVPVTLTPTAFAALPLAGQIASVIDAGTLPETPTAVPDKILVTIIGHSLGAALATLLCVSLIRSPEINVSLLCTFASPRVGDAAFVGSFTQAGIESWRIVNRPDIVANVPLAAMGYAHLPGLQIFDSTGLVHTSEDCAHSLNTYLYLLGDTALIPTGLCQPDSTDIALGERAKEAALAPIRDAYDAELRR